MLPLAKGAYSLVFMDEQTLYAARDPQGFRPLVLGALEGGWVVASETAALDIVGAAFVREIAPGELVCINGRGVRSGRSRRRSRGDACSSTSTWPVPTRRFPAGGCTPPGSPSAGGSRPSTPRTPTWSSRSPVGNAGRDRVRRGQRHPVRAGAGQELLRRPDLHPAQPDDQGAGHQAEAEPAPGRHRGPAAGRGRRLDRPREHAAALVAMLREAGAAQVHVRVASPPVNWPCFYGIDFANRAELIAGHCRRRRSAPRSARTPWATCRSRG